ncbi:MAG: hypothetical protein KKF44_07760 [Nanoarchaeota archaeon]|nr:hypothetical protein [Nanoarchaeota archaeon]
MKFCPSCGKDIKEGVFCEDCEPLPDIKIKDIKIKTCSVCNKFLHQNKWKNYTTIHDAVVEVVSKGLEKQIKDFFVNPNLPPYKNNPGIKVEFLAEVVKGKNMFIVPGEINITSCPICSKEGTGYFEGILQLRKPTEEIISFIDDFFKAKQMSVLIIDKKKVKDGFDITVISKKILRDLAKKLSSEFGGILKESPHIHSYDNQTSKNIYRLNVYFEGHDFRTGDVIKHDDKVIKIAKLGKTIYGTDVRTGKSLSFKLNNKNYTLLKVYKTTVSKVSPTVEVLDPKDYQSKVVENKTTVKSGEKVKVVVENGKIYVV